MSPDSLTSAERALAAALGPQTRTAYRALYGYALELKGSADSSLAVRREWREELLRRWTDAGVAVPRATFDSAQATVDHMLAARVGRFAFGEAQVLRRYWREDAVLARAVTLLGAARTTPELIALGARETRLTSTPPAGKPKG